MRFIEVVELGGSLVESNNGTKHMSDTTSLHAPGIKNGVYLW